MSLKIKSKSPLFNSIIKNVDEILSGIPEQDVEGCDIEDSLSFDSYVSALENANAKDETGRYFYPIDKTLAITLIQDEMKQRRENNE
tara:strand:- start:679 stop:939 length:261 start_codon:yes stop_codon:yes gene_type:complete